MVNLIYHMENQKLDRYVGDYDRFMEVYEMKKSQLEAAYNRQQAEIAKLQEFVARNKARVATRNMAMSRQKKLDKMEVIELAKEKPKPEFHFLNARATGKPVSYTHLARTRRRRKRIGSCWAESTVRWPGRQMKCTR